MPSKESEDALFRQDEHPRPHTTLEKLSSLRLVLIDKDPEATVTAGNASGENAAACCIVTAAQQAGELGPKPAGKLLAWAVAGVHPAYMGIGPVPATKKALECAGLTLKDIGPD